MFTDEEHVKTDSADTFVFSREVIMNGADFPNSDSGRLQKDLLEKRMKVLVQVLAAFGLLEDFQ